MKIRYTCLFILLICLPLLVKAQASSTQDRNFDHLLRCEVIGMEQGLPESSAWSVYEDHLGLIWVGTQMGLARYDGEVITTFNFLPADSLYGLYSPIVARAITEDSAGDLWIGTAGGMVFRFDRHTERFIPYVKPPPDDERFGPPIGKILADSQQNVWVANRYGGLIRLRVSEDKRHWPESTETPWDYYFTEEGTDSPGELIMDIKLDQKGTLWATTESGLAHWDQTDNQFDIFPIPDPLVKKSRYFHPTALSFDPDGAIWLAAGNGLLRFYPQTEKYESIPLAGDMEGVELFRILRSRSGKIWFLDYQDYMKKVFVYDPAVKEWSKFYVQLPNDADRRFFMELIEDHNGIIWIADRVSGLLKYRPETAAFQWIRHDPELQNGLSSNKVTPLHESAQGDIWISNHGKGIDRWDRQANVFTHYRHRPDDPATLSGDWVYCITEDEHAVLWMATSNGIDQFDRKTGTFRRLNDRPDFPEGLKNQVIYYLTFDAEGGLWIATNSNGLQYYHPESGTQTRYDQSLFLQLYSIPNEVFADSRGSVWIRTGGNKFYHFNPETEALTGFPFKPGGSFYEDEEQTVWVSTYGSGLIGINIEDLSWRQYGRRDGLPSEKIVSTVPDNRGYLWVGTTQGLSRFDPKNRTAQNFLKPDGLLSNTIGRGLLLRDGQLLFGTPEGLLLFHPDSIRVDTAQSRVVLLELKVADQTLADLKNDPALSGVSGIQELELGYRQNDISFRFAAMNFRNPTQTRYQVMLVNYDDHWLDRGTQNTANYTNLDPGRYTLRVRSANGAGEWNDKGLALDIFIRPPWFWNTWSQLLYLLLLIMGITSLYRFQLKRRLALAEADSLRELDEVKTKLYTNITHEFRTPLTVIQGISEQIEGHQQEKELIRRNSQNLLDLVNRILDLSKASVGKLRLQLVQGDIVPYLRYVTKSFHSLALNQKINLNFYTDLEVLEMDYDPEKTLQMLSNLISNAIKFTPEYGKVTITVRKKAEAGLPQLEIRVKDTGIGMEAEQLPLIFDRFHQVDAGPARRTERLGSGASAPVEPLRKVASAPVGGTGIGLALTKELVDLMQGEIRVESRPGVGSLFTVLLPIRNTAAREMRSELVPEANSGSIYQNIPDERLMPSDQQGSDEERPRLLIVEDNQDVMQFIASCLQNDYELLTARNGREGIEQALEYIPDIIISDVMMPEVDGFELCSTLKQDERTDHIPIILLTAKADQDSKLEGLEYGADAYLIKPFHRTELEIRLRKLIELRRRLQTRYNQATFEPEPATAKVHAFVLKARNAVLEHLSDETFGPEPLSKLLLLHRSQLHRKLKALTGKSTSIFIREIRLQRADQLLQESDLSVKEVAYEVGFSDPGYFSKLFVERYGRPPSEV